MPDYKKMYCSLFNDVTQVIRQLQAAQQKTEELYMHTDETPVNILRKEDHCRNGKQQKN